MIPVDGHPNLYRDQNSGAIINCDSQSYNQYINMVNNKKIQREEIDQLKKDIEEIKTLLRNILNGSK